jgi:hypothetical protein
MARTKSGTRIKRHLVKDRRIAQGPEQLAGKRIIAAKKP